MMGTEDKNGQNLTVESTETTPTVTVSMKKLVAGVGTMFAGVLQMLEALEPQAAKQLMGSRGAGCRKGSGRSQRYRFCKRGNGAGE